jgi:SAM-dependent methyltransferase
VSTGEYDRLDAELYDAYTGASIDGDVEFYVEEARRAGSPVLELGCGTGRILMPVAMAGIDVVGLDRAPNMLAVAGEKRAALEPDVRRRIALIEGDMRSFSLGQRFSLVMIPFRAFLHLLTVDDQRQTLASVRDHLAPDGHLALNIFDPDLSIIQARQGVHAGTLQSQKRFRHPRTGRPAVLWDSFRYDPERQMLIGEFIFEELDDAGRVVERLYAPLMLRWVYRYEMQHLLELAGFRIEALYGDFRRGPFRHGGEQVWIARKA